MGWRSRDLRPLLRDLSETFRKIVPFLLKRGNKNCSKVSRQSRDLRRLSRDRSATFFKICLICLKRQKSCLTVDLQSRDLRRLSRDRSATFSKFCHFGWNVKKMLFESQRTIALPPTTVAWPLSDFLEKIPIRLKLRKNVVWQSANGRMTSDDCHVTVQRLFSKFCHFSWNVEIKLFDSQPTVAWPPTIVAWPFSDFYKFFVIFAETSKYNCFTISRRSRDLQRLSHDRSVTFFKILPFWLKRRKICCLKVSGRSRDRPATLFTWFFRTASTYSGSRMYLLLFFFPPSRSAFVTTLSRQLVLEEYFNPGILFLHQS